MLVFKDVTADVQRWHQHVNAGVQRCNEEQKAKEKK
jgi:hypothetical protein